MKMVSVWIFLMSNYYYYSLIYLDDSLYLRCHIPAVLTKIIFQVYVVRSCFLESMTKSSKSPCEQDLLARKPILQRVLTAVSEIVLPDEAIEYLEPVKVSTSSTNFRLPHLLAVKKDRPDQILVDPNFRVDFDRFYTSPKPTLAALIRVSMSFPWPVARPVIWGFRKRRLQLCSRRKTPFPAMGPTFCREWQPVMVVGGILVIYCDLRFLIVKYFEFSLNAITR